MSSWDDQITLILTKREAVALSAAILALGTCHHRPELIESIRKKLRAGLDHRLKQTEDEEAQIAILALEYARLR